MKDRLPLRESELPKEILLTNYKGEQRSYLLRELNQRATIVRAEGVDHRFSTSRRR